MRRTSQRTPFVAAAWLRRVALVASLWLGAPAMAVDGTAVVPARGWEYRVHVENLPAVDNLALGADGALFATLELPSENGRVVRIKDGIVQTVLADLNRPDGLVLRGKKLYVTEEVNAGRVIEFNLEGGEREELVTLHNPEGIAVLPNGDLVLSEDSVNGRLVLLHRRTGKVETLIGGLNRPEGLAVAADGTIFVAETATGRILSFRDGYLKTVVDDLDEPDQLRIGPDGALWITEDTPRGRLLRLKDGALNVILSGLNAPQGMVFGPNGMLYLAEQGRARILKLVSQERRP